MIKKERKKERKKEFLPCAIRSRDPINPCNRNTKSIMTIGMLEISNNKNICNCVTTVTKDFMVLIIDKSNKLDKEI